MKSISYIDTEVGITDKLAYDFGVVDETGNRIHTSSSKEFHAFISESDYLCGHNIIDHDLKYIDAPSGVKIIDTLYLSPLLFPNRPYRYLFSQGLSRE